MSLKHLSLDRIKIFDQQIRQGKGQEVAQELKFINPSSPPRELRGPLANIYLRLGQAEQSLKLLNRIVRGKGKQPMNPSPKETREYGAALIALGAATEGIELLESSEINPETLLSLAIGHFSLWDYPKAIPYLRELLNHPLCPPYQRALGLINLASAHIFLDDFHQAHQQLSDFFELAEGDPEFTLLLGNAYELRAQVYMFTSRHQEARRALIQARTLQAKHLGISTLFIEKWEAVNGALNPSTREQGLNQLYEVTKKAKALKHWETYRDCCFYLSMSLRDEAEFFKVYFGTPYPGYRKKMLSDFPEEIKLPKSYVHKFWYASDEMPHQFNLSTGVLEGTGKSLEVGNLSYRLFCLLAKDLFRPIGVFKLFSELFPEEQFDPFSSPHRVYENIGRLRKELHRQKIPLEVSEEQGTYSIKPRGPVALRFDSTPLPGNRSLMQLKRFLNLRFEARSFTRKDFCRELGVSYRSAERLLNWATAQNHLGCQKVGRILYYTPRESL